MRFWLLNAYPMLGLAGSLVILVGTLIPAFFYRGKDGEPYLLTRHFISELGEIGVSRMAFVFNTALILAGSLITLMLLGLGLELNSAFGFVAMASGLVTAVATVFVGVFPMNYIKPHTTAAMTFFRSGLVTVLLFCAAILLQPADQRVIPLYTLAFGLLSFMAYGAFLIHAARVSKRSRENVLDTEKVMRRPDFWWLPFLEWLVLISTILWFLVICTIR